MAEEIHAAHGSLDVLMNVAGVSAWGAVENLEHHHWQRMIDVNLMGPIHVIESFVPAMIAAGRGGHLVNVSSAAGLFGLPWHAAYSASKFGLRGVSEVLRFDLRRHDIGVSLVCPGAVKTPLVGTVEIAGINRDDPYIAKLVARFEKHAVTPEHVADRILKAIEQNRYLVFTSRDIQLGHWFQRKFAPAYELAMRLMNDRATAVAQHAAVSPGRS
jgi:NAD(P)-dependent dehydrogenase (short-subunit alcohol dehydrogenase family)